MTGWVTAGLLAGVLGLPAAQAEDEKVKWQQPAGRAKVHKQPASDVAGPANRSTERERKIARIVSEHLAGRVPRAEAARQLRPLIKERMDEQRATAEIRRAYLESELDALDVLMRDPDGALEQHLTELLAEPLEAPAGAPETP